MTTAIEIIRTLGGLECRCKKPKRAHDSFCRWCYGKLPPTMQRALYQRVGDGYEQAYGAAVDFLDEFERAEEAKRASIRRKP